MSNKLQFNRKLFFDLDPCTLKGESKNNFTTKNNIFLALFRVEVKQKDITSIFNTKQTIVYWPKNIIHD